MALLKSVRRNVRAAAAMTLLGVAAAGCSMAAATPTSTTQSRSSVVTHRTNERVNVTRHVQTTDNRVAVVGDSLTVGTEPWLRADLRRAGWTLATVNARVGRPVAEGLAVLRASAARLPATVVVALGTNDLGAGTATVDKWMTDARRIVGGRRLIWVNVCPSAAAGQARLAGARVINAALSSFAPHVHVQIADWCSFAAKHGIAPGPDGFHYSPTGYQARAAFYAAALGRRQLGAEPITSAQRRPIA